MSLSVCTEVPVFLTEMPEEIQTLEGVFVAENVNGKGLSLVSTRWYVTVLQALCQCVARYLCCRPSVSMLTCLHATGPVSVY